MSDLLPCPFCGNPPEMSPEPTGEFNNHFWYVACWNNGCPVVNVETQGHLTEAEAATAWNTRPTIPASAI